MKQTIFLKPYPPALFNYVSYIKKMLMNILNKKFCWKVLFRTSKRWTHIENIKWAEDDDCEEEGVVVEDGEGGCLVLGNLTILKSERVNGVLTIRKILFWFLLKLKIYRFVLYVDWSTTTFLQIYILTTQ